MRICRTSGAVTKSEVGSLGLTVVLSTTLNCYFRLVLAGTTVALLLATLKRLASRGGRTRTSTRFPVLGRQFKKGACTSPLFPFLLTHATIHLPGGSLDTTGSTSRLQNRKVRFDRSTRLERKMRLKKVSGRWGFRPLGRGDGGKRNPKLFLTSRHYAALASSTTAHRSSRNRPGSRDQLPITVAIVLGSGSAVDSAVVPYHPVLFGLCFRTVSQVPWYRRLRTIGYGNLLKAGLRDYSL